MLALFLPSGSRTRPLTASGVLRIAMIKELSEHAQFIITTFRAELLAHSDQFFGVIFDARKVSTVKSITREDCETFVEANEKTS